MDTNLVIHLLQISVALIFFANKSFVLVGKRFGWFLGALAAFIAVFYFYLIQLYIYTVLEVGLIILMGYGFIKPKENNGLELAIRLTIAGIMLILSMFAFNGLLTIYELLSSAGLLFGTYFLTHSKVKLGWFISGLAHLLAMQLGYEKNQNFFADFQLASAIISFIGITIKSKN
jgi:hypothetical protein